MKNEVKKIDSELIHITYDFGNIETVQLFHLKKACDENVLRNILNKENVKFFITKKFSLDELSHFILSKKNKEMKEMILSGEIEGVISIDVTNLFMIKNDKETYFSIGYKKELLVEISKEKFLLMLK